MSPTRVDLRSSESETTAADVFRDSTNIITIIINIETGFFFFSLSVRTHGPGDDGFFFSFFFFPVYYYYKRIFFFFSLSYGRARNIRILLTGVRFLGK